MKKHEDHQLCPESFLFPINSILAICKSRQLAPAKLTPRLHFDLKSSKGLSDESLAHIKATLSSNLDEINHAIHIESIKESLSTAEYQIESTTINVEDWHLMIQSGDTCYILTKKPAVKRPSSSISLAHSNEVGINNFGNTCFFNAIIQSFFCLHSLKFSLHRYRACPWASELEILLWYIYENDQANTNSQARKYLEKLGPFWNRGGQYDAKLLYLELINKLPEALAKELFFIEREYKLQCISCEFTSSHAEKFAFLQAFDGLTIQKCLLKFIYEDNQPHRVPCERCRGETCEMRVANTVYPSILVFYAENERTLTYDDLRREEGNMRYLLKAVVMRSGPNSKHGHFWTLAINGYEITIISDMLVEKTTFDRAQFKGAYLFFYERQ